MKVRSLTFVLAAALFSSAAIADAPICPTNMAKNECVYFKEGYAVGKEDSKKDLSNAYQRHEESYDSRFESAFSKGYEQGWKDGKDKK